MNRTGVRCAVMIKVAVLATLGCGGESKSDTGNGGVHGSTAGTSGASGSDLGGTGGVSSETGGALSMAGKASGGGMTPAAGAGGTTGVAGASGDESGAGGAAGIPKDQFSAAFVSSVCGNISDCCRRAGYMADLTTCQSNAAALAAAYTSGDPNKTAYDPVAAGTCTSGLAEALKQCVRDPMTDATIGDACRRIMIGKVSAGGACATDHECAPVDGATVACAPDASTGSKYCVLTLDPVRAAAGDACDETCDEHGCSSHGQASGTGEASPIACFTDDSLYCATPAQGGKGVCSPLPAIGAKCDSVCESGAFCDPATGTCLAERDAGPCDPSVPGGCSSSTFCDEQSSQCLPLRVDGDACSSAVECANGECSGGVCGPALEASKSLCGGAVG